MVLTFVIWWQALRVYSCLVCGMVPTDDAVSIRRPDRILIGVVKIKCELGARAADKVHDPKLQVRCLVTTAGGHPLSIRRKSNAGVIAELTDGLQNLSATVEQSQLRGSRWTAGTVNQHPSEGSRKPHRFDPVCDGPRIALHLQPARVNPLSHERACQSAGRACADNSK